MVIGGFLVWVRDDGGKPQPQKWEIPPASMLHDYWKKHGRVIVVLHLTVEDFAQPLVYLAMKYPAPEESNEVKFTIDNTKSIEGKS